MFSVGIIYSAKDFLDYIESHTISIDEFKLSFEKFSYASPEVILQLVTECGWVHLTTNGEVKLTKRGVEISHSNYESAILLQMEDMICQFNPSWASLIPKGRKEALAFLPEDVQQCFKEAGFYGDFTDRLVRMWDRLSLSYRNYNHELLLNTGRKGERLTLAFEEKRTGKLPVWQSLESNLSGFDILSTVDKNSNSKLLIEVKATTSKTNYASLYISKNEWETAQISSNYLIHVWVLSSSSPELFIINIQEISKHIAKNNGKGKWQSVRIPLSVLTNKKQPDYKIPLP